jgi:hypothetical protein
MTKNKKVLWLGRTTAPALTLALAAGVLIWMKLRLVTGVPRSVYAEPIVMPTIPTDVNLNIPSLTVDTADKEWRRTHEEPAPSSPRPE